MTAVAIVARNARGVRTVQVVALPVSLCSIDRQTIRATGVLVGAGSSLTIQFSVTADERLTSSPLKMGFNLEVQTSLPAVTTSFEGVLEDGGNGKARVVSGVVNG